MADQIAKDAHLAATVLKTLSNDSRTVALKIMHDALRDSKDKVIEANKLDLKEAQTAGLSQSLIKRLDLASGDKYDSMLQGILDVATLDDPVGKITLATKLDEGLELYRVTCPVGTLLVIFEARPEVIANISALAIKSGNAAILKGGKESIHSFKAMADAVTGALSKSEVPKNAIQLVATRDEVGELLKQDKFIDLVIPRGSNALVKNIKDNTKIPVMGHADGICSIYVDIDADAEMAARIVVDAKTNYPAGCNAVETLLVNSSIATTKFIKVTQALLDANVKIRATADLIAALESANVAPHDNITLATEADFETEFLEFTIAVKSVPDVAGAIYHVNTHGSKHTDCIVTENADTAQKFLRGIDAAGVYWNASTRFADGFRYGFGTEVGVSTNKIHARGPVGLEGLVGYQYILKGNGHIVSDYAGAGGKKPFLHEPIQF
ncbi:gamma-glutamyl phosphate reductase [Nadsonia fulvescens var. elongata DSM 6958]|uniref:glutamate-5-semialdehyde dehydrogenase n=1 Tax=Nadsonia fulvescens var. elongata DSM 6958 TaxID=857566 RepID=A0A1E3PE09_9ASCO|nr:gamma-glutamyl phosphate reductase [Nadsonia fulvescens var. elongata DSM 6958]